jgi:hypothetical protein
MVLIPKIYHAKYLMINRVNNLGETRVGVGEGGVGRKQAVTQLILSLIKE